jgi:hypothetical protein
MYARVHTQRVSLNDVSISFKFCYLIYKLYIAIYIIKIEVFSFYLDKMKIYFYDFFFFFVFPCLTMICLINFSPALTFKMHAFWCTVMWLMDEMISRFCVQQNSKSLIWNTSHKLIRQRWRTVIMIFVLENVVPRVSCWSSWVMYLCKPDPTSPFLDQMLMVHLFNLMYHVLVHRTSKVFIKNM